MHTKSHRKISRRNSNKSRKMRGGKSQTGKKWTTAIEAAHYTLSKTGSLNAARKTLRKQALANARKLFGSI
jgi:hypothetical protein